MRAHHTGIRYPDFEDARSFWVDKMDWRVLQTWPYGDLTLAYVMPPDQDDFHLVRSTVCCASATSPRSPGRASSARWCSRPSRSTSDRSILRAARAVPVHVNTLHYRLRRFEELTGCRLDSTETIVEVSFALGVTARTA